MSGLKPIALGNFYRSFHARDAADGQPWTLKVLAKALNCGRSHLSQVLNGKRTGKPTWRKIEASGFLTARELELLGRNVGQREGGATDTGSAAARVGVPRETNSHMEHAPAEVSA